MKRIIALLTLVFTFAASPIVSAAGIWQIDMSTPAEAQTSRSFNVQFTTLSTEASDTINVQLFQNDVSIAASTTTRPFGDSGAFAVTVPSDGVYEYYLRAVNDGEVKTTAKKSVTVDATAPAAAQYGSKTRSGNTYTITFTAPSNSDVRRILIYSSPSTTFTANASTFVGSVSVTSGQAATFTYTAPDSAERYHAVQAVDSAGNSSAPVGDTNTIVTAAPQRDVATIAAAEEAALIARGGNGGGAGSRGATGAAGTNGTSSDSTGTPFNSSEGLDKNGDVLGAESKENSSNRTRNTIAIALLALAVVAAAILLARRRANSE